jgi:hypothetical protein
MSYNRHISHRRAKHHTTGTSLVGEPNIIQPAHLSYESQMSYNRHISRRRAKYHTTGTSLVGEPNIIQPAHLSSESQISYNRHFSRWRAKHRITGTSLVGEPNNISCQCKATTTIQYFPSHIRQAKEIMHKCLIAKRIPDITYSSFRYDRE